MKFILKEKAEHKGSSDFLETARSLKGIKVLPEDSINDTWK